MNLKPIGNNVNEVTVGDMSILFSYRTPVAIHFHDTGETYRTSYKWSNTTTRHINKWLGNEQASEKPQQYFDCLLDKVK